LGAGNIYLREKKLLNKMGDVNQRQKGNMRSLKKKNEESKKYYPQRKISWKD